MKRKYYLILAVITFLISGMVIFSGSRVFAQTVTPTSQPQQTCEEELDDDTEVQDDADTDDVEFQCGDDTTADSQEVEDNGSDDNEENDEIINAAPAISLDQAKETALSVYSGAILKTELEDENGTLLYSVEFEDSLEVKVDAMAGNVIGTEKGDE